MSTVFRNTFKRFASQIGAALVGFIQAGAGAIKQTVQDILRERVSINSFLTTPGVITQADYDKAKAQALAVGGVLKISGAYTFGALNLAAQGLTVECGAKTTLTHTGAGVALSIDGGTVGTGMFNFKLRGNPLVVGNVNTTDGVFVRAMHHSDIECRAKDVTNGWRINFAVCSKFKATCSINADGFARTPTAGIITDVRGAGEAVQDCTFYVVMEGINGTGVELNNTNGCEFMGTSEANATGVTHGATCARNRFIGLDMESNTVRDLQDYSENATYADCFALSTGSGNNAELVSSRGAKFYGGFWRTVNIQAASVDTLFIGVSTSDNAGLGFTGPGSYKTLNCVKQDPTGATTARIADRMGEPGGTWEPAFASAGGGAQGAVTAAVGTSCRMGNLGYVQGFMSIAKGTLSAGPVSIVGLPFASRGTANDYQYISMAEWDNIALGAGYTTLVMRIAPGSNVGTLLKSGAAVPSANVNVADFPATMGIRFSGVYEIA